MHCSLHEYQTRAVQHVLDNPGAGLFMRMGLGKTVVALTAIGDLLDSITVTRVLIVGPLRVILSTWPSEIEKWDHTKHLTYTLIRGTPKERKAQALTPTNISLVNYENLDKLVTDLGKKWPWDMIVLDESSMVKSSKTQRWRALRRVRPFVDRVLLLTGTPAPNNISDLWAQLYLLDQGTRLGRTKGAFLARWGTSDYWHKWTPFPHAVAEITDRIKDICLSMRSEDYIQLPELVTTTVPVVLDEASRAVYEELRKEFIVQFYNENQGALTETVVTAANAAVLTAKLRQVARGVLYHNQEDARGRATWTELHEEKLDALESIIDDAEGDPIFVAYEYVSDVVLIQERWPEARHLDDKPETVDAWNRGEIPILCAHPASAGFGLNLQAGGRTVVWFGPTWSSSFFEQFVARLHRQGQTRTVFCYFIVAVDTIDERVLDVMLKKISVQDALMAELRRKPCGSPATKNRESADSAATPSSSGGSGSTTPPATPSSNAGTPAA